MSHADQINCASAFANTEGMPFSFENPLDMWKTDGGAKMEQASPDSSYFHNLTPTGSSAGSSAHMGTSMPDTLGQVPLPDMYARKPTKEASLDERFACIMEQVEAAGFESFDSMATAYYTQTFGNSSPLADEQRLSRNRRLPQVISDVYGATNQWTDWERKGFQDEIMKTAESMLSNEGCGARSSLAANINALVEAQDNGNLAAANEAMMAMKQTIQQEVNKHQFHGRYSLLTALISTGS